MGERELKKEGSSRHTAHGDLFRRAVRAPLEFLLPAELARAPRLDEVEKSIDRNTST